MLDRCVSVAEVAEVVDVLRAEQNACSERVDRRIAPLVSVSYTRWICEDLLTRSIQKPPLRSIISKKSLYSLLRNQLSLAISKLDQK